jgi:hypothetical protein
MLPHTVSTFTGCRCGIIPTHQIRKVGDLTCALQAGEVSVFHIRRDIGARGRHALGVLKQIFGNKVLVVD